MLNKKFNYDPNTDMNKILNLFMKKVHKINTDNHIDTEPHLANNTNPGEIKIHNSGKVTEDIFIQYQQALAQTLDELKAS